MSPFLPFDIIALIVDIVGENNDTNLLQELALVSHSFHQICSGHLFATVRLHDANLTYHIASSKKGFVKLLRSRPDVAKHIRKLTYTIEYDHVQSPQFSPHHLNFYNEDNLLSPILPNFLRTIYRLSSLKIHASQLDWNQLNPSLKSALLHLMHLPTIDRIDLSFIHNFPLSSLVPSINLLRLDISHVIDVERFGEEGPPELVVQSEIMPKIREFRTLDSSVLTTKLLHAKMQDGRPAFNFTDLKRLRMPTWFEDKQNIRYLLQNAKSLEKLHLSIGHQGLVGLHDILSLSSRTLKVLDLSVSFYPNRDPIALWEELDAMAGLIMLESLSFKFQVNGNQTEDFVGSILRNMEEVLVKPGWSLKQVSLKIEVIPTEDRDSAEFIEALQSLPDKCLSHFPKRESFTFNFSAYVPSSYIWLTTH